MGVADSGISAMMKKIENHNSQFKSMHASDVNVIILNVKASSLGWTRLPVLNVRLSGLDRKREISKISRPRSLMQCVSHLRIPAI